MITGYLHNLYANSFSAHGSPFYLQSSGTWILRRSISDFPYQDAMGLYPILCCRNWDALASDIDILSNSLVTFSGVTDPFGNYTFLDLQMLFPDVCIPFKEHFVVDLQQDPHSFVDAHHRRNVKQSFRSLEVEVSHTPSAWLDDWESLYGVLIERHRIKGITRFCRDSFEKQLSVPGIVAFRSLYQDSVVGMLLWYKQGDVAYYHLGAYSDLGYQRKAAFALFWTAIEYFTDRGIRWLSLGAGAGTESNALDGLTRFKRGWSTGTRTAYLCGRVLNQDIYHEIIRRSNVPSTKFFPAYRLGEL